MSVQEELDEFFSTADPSEDLASSVKNVEQFVTRHNAEGRSIVLVTVSCY